MTALLATLINMIPGLHLRGTAEAEHLGMDDDQVRVLFIGRFTAFYFRCGSTAERSGRCFLIFFSLIPS